FQSRNPPQRPEEHVATAPADHVLSRRTTGVGSCRAREERASDALRRRYCSAPGPSLKSDGTNVCGSAGSVRSACCRAVSLTSGGGSTRARDQAICETQYL